MLHTGLHLQNEEKRSTIVALAATAAATAFWREATAVPHSRGVGAFPYPNHPRAPQSWPPPRAPPPLAPSAVSPSDATPTPGRPRRPPPRPRGATGASAHNSSSGRRMRRLAASSGPALHDADAVATQDPAECGTVRAQAWHELRSVP
jgi:hypothetical protein